MPTYEYRRPDGTTFEIQQSFSDDSLTEDPETGVPVQRVLHAPAVHFKGKGFYNTDYGTRKRQRENAASNESSSSGDSPSKDASGDSSTGDSGKSGGSDSTPKGESTSKSGDKKGESSPKVPAKSDAKPVAAAK
ncbi:MAG: zinc ribbon domain-containing protein [Solirubrobacteraceae bacterium]